MRIKEAKQNIVKRKKLVAFLAVLMIVAFLMFLACSFKTLYLAIVSTNSNLVLMGAACSLAAIWAASALENLIAQVRKGR